MSYPIINLLYFFADIIGVVMDLEPVFEMQTIYGPG